MIAYDHSRVLLSAIDGMPPTDIFLPTAVLILQTASTTVSFRPQERKHAVLLKYIPTQASQTT